MADAPIVSINAEHPQPRTIERAIKLLDDGELIAYPTDTYFGIGCDLLNKKAIDKLYQLKQRDRRKPLAFLVNDLSHVADYARVSNFAFRAIRRLTPGPFTFILEATRAVPEQMATRQREVGVRIPASPVALALAEKLGRPIVSTTATNPDGEVLVDAKDIQDVLGHGLKLILDAGIVQNEPSTVISLLNDGFQILRQGKGDASTFVGRG